MAIDRLGTTTTLSQQQRAALATIAALATAASVHAQQTIYVDASAPAGGNGTSWAQAYKDLQDALDHVPVGNAASPPVEVHIAKGTYKPTKVAISVASAVSMDLLKAFKVLSPAPLSLIGGFAGRQSSTPDARDPQAMPTILSGDIPGNDGPNFTNHGDNCLKILVTSEISILQLDGLQITASQSIGLYLGSSANNAFVSIRQCAFHNIGPESQFDSEASVISFNRLNYNPNIHPQIIISKSSFTSNDVSVGIGDTDWDISRCVITDNAGRFHLIEGNAINIDHSIIARNQAGKTITSSYGTIHWSGALLDGNSSHISASTLVDNVADDVLFISSQTIENTTIARNTARGYLVSVTALCNWYNTILWGNRTGAPAHLPAMMEIQSNGTINFDHCLLEASPSSFVQFTSQPLPLHPYTTSNTFIGDPLFVNAPNPDTNPSFNQMLANYRLSATSPAIDFGTTTFLANPSTYIDLNGRGFFDVLTRPNAGAGWITYADVGAYEFLPNPADFNGDNAIDVADIFAFLRSWFSRSIAGDFNHDNSIDVADIFAYLRAWFAK